MKQLFTLFVGLLITVGYGQKKELKLAKKQFKAANYEEASATLTTHQALIESSDDPKITTQYHFLKGQIARINGDFQVAYDNLLLAEGNKSLSAVLGDEKQQLTADIVNTAIQQSEEKEYVVSSDNLYLAYTMNPEVNIDYLYYSATNAVNGSAYELALERYLELRTIKYTGIVTKYYATQVATGEEIEVSATEFEIYKKSKEFMNLREEDTASKYPEIVKNIALIYNQLGNKEKAMQAVKDAREANPGDIGLILTEANIYIQLGEKERYQELIIEALEQDPNNAVLYYNLGVVNAEQGEKVKAREYYEKAISLDPSMENVYLNLVALILEDEAAIVESMNSLGNSRADNLKYDELKAKRESLYTECVPILKKLIAIDETNLEAVKTLKNIYGTIGENDGFMEMKAILEKYEE